MRRCIRASLRNEPGLVRRFEVGVAEAGSRTGGQVFTSEFVGHWLRWALRGAGCPVHTHACDAGALRSKTMPASTVLTVAQGGDIIERNCKEA